MNDYFANALSVLKDWIKIKSVKSKPTKNAPFGKGVSKMLSKALSDAENLGFETKNYDGFIGEVVFGSGNDRDGLAVLCHLDVVPEGDLSLWNVSPYSAVEKDGYLYGRGVVDDKGAAALCLFALKELKDEGFVPSKKIKLILGCDEESGWGCIDHYNEVAVMPKIGFSPDGEFPVTYAEKGIYHVKYSFPISKAVKSVLGGDRINVVCDKAQVTIDGQDYNFSGVSAHGSTPELGDNAIKKALKFLVEKGLFREEVYENLFSGRLFEKFKDESGILTFSPNVIKKVGENVEVFVDVRYPVHYTLSEVDGALKKIGEYEVIEHKKPLYADKNGALVQTLNSVYEKHTGEKAISQTTGGGTYARALELGVAFGPSLGKDLCCHVPNERMKIEDLKLCYAIYKDAIKELSK
ncbi:MAG: Sapep family Mn(2+)-dependent dipeptidase [Clostridia bacterium]|nr:Sapep family Mn(2+)-dependent dipeptidase [Clostridia bacterium]